MQQNVNWIKKDLNAQHKLGSKTKDSGCKEIMLHNDYILYHLIWICILMWWKAEYLLGHIKSKCLLLR